MTPPCGQGKKTLLEKCSDARIYTASALCGSALLDYAFSVLIILPAFTAMLSLRFSESVSGLPLLSFLLATVGWVYKSIWRAICTRLDKKRRVLAHE